MKLSIRLHRTGLLLSNTISILELFGVERARLTFITEFTRPTDSGKTPNYVAVDETVIRVDGHQYWLSAAADPASNDLLHVPSARNQATMELFLAELTEKHDVGNAVFFVDSAPWPHAALYRYGLRVSI